MTIIALIVSIIWSVISLMMFSLILSAHAEETPFQHGYLGGISDGQDDARDWGDACGKYYSTAQDSCLAGYNLGFPKGCIGVSSKHDTNAEYMTCFDYFKAIQTQK